MQKSNLLGRGTHEWYGNPPKRYKLRVTIVAAAVAATLTFLACQAHYSTVLQRDYIRTSKVDGFIANALASCTDAAVLADPLPAENMPRAYP